MKRFAFTLAETLTALLIIGAISAITIPVLNTNISKQKKIAMLKKFYSDFSINIQTVLGESNCQSISCLRKYGNVANPTSHNGVFANPDYINVASICNGCFDLADVMPLGFSTNVFSKYKLSSGASMALYDFRGNCNNHDGGYVVANKIIEEVNARGAIVRHRVAENNVNICGIVVFDLNATKGPNVPGGDRFAYYIADEPIDNSYLVPIGYTTDDYKNNKSKYNVNGLISSQLGDGTCRIVKNQIGYNCTAKIMLDGWKIKY